MRRFWRWRCTCTNRGPPPPVTCATRSTRCRTASTSPHSARRPDGGWHTDTNRPTTGRVFTACTYDGYTNENKVISLAAHLSTRRHVAVETYWNSDKNRVLAHLVGLQQRRRCIRSTSFGPRSPGALNLYVDVRERGTDMFPETHLAANPWENFVCYEEGVMAKLAQMGRTCLVQPDAGDDGSLKNYQQFSLYNDFGQGDLFMPWSVALALLADAKGSEDALRFLLRHDLHDALGLSDSAKWATGEPNPYDVTARHDFWNMSLATMALLERLDGESRLSRFFAGLPEVRVALDRGFGPPQTDRNAAERVQASRR